MFLYAFSHAYTHNYAYDSENIYFVITYNMAFDPTLKVMSYAQGAMFKFGGLFRILGLFLSSKINL